jgi:hypothetical protein
MSITQPIPWTTEQFNDARSDAIHLLRSNNTRLTSGEVLGLCAAVVARGPVDNLIVQFEDGEFLVGLLCVPRGKKQIYGCHASMDEAIKQFAAQLVDSWVVAG